MTFMQWPLLVRDDHFDLLKLLQYNIADVHSWYGFVLALAAYYVQAPTSLEASLFYFKS
jgi:hypothetical protein